MILYNEFGLKGSGWSAGWNEREAADCAVRTSVILLSAPAALIIASLSAPAVYMLWLAWYTGARCWRDSPLLRPVSPITSHHIATTTVYWMRNLRAPALTPLEGSNPCTAMPSSSWRCLRPAVLSNALQQCHTYMLNKVGRTQMESFIHSSAPSERVRDIATVGYNLLYVWAQWLVHGRLNAVRDAIR